MTSIIKFHALSGVMDETPPCYILQVDEFRFLLDCGWDEKFDEEFIKELRRHVNQIDAVLLTFPDPHHLGALPYLVGKCGLSCPIYATIPVYKMGQMFMYDLYQSRYNMEEFDLFNLDDVDSAFDKIIQLKYNQSVAMKGKGYGLTIVPLPSGHMIGGTMWKIMKVGEEDIIYAIDVNHKKERHLNGCDLERPQRPSLLITDALNATYRQDRRRLRDERLMTTILQTLRTGGNILIAVDTAGRLLELAHMLDQFWRNKSSGLLVYSLLLLNNVSYNVVEFAKSQIEWMSDKLMKSFEVQRNNPFQFKYLHLCHSLTELNKITGPKVVLASCPDMESGFAREIFLDWAAESTNSIILTTRSGTGTLASRLIALEGKEKNQRKITVTIKQRVKLEGDELQQYLEDHQMENQDKDSSDSDDDVQFLSVLKGGHDLVVKPELKKRSSKSKRKSYPMYPLIDQKVKFDDYGEIIRPEDYMLSENKDDVIELKDVKPTREEEPVDGGEVPTKCISYEKVIDVNANIQYIDFEGRSDGDSIEKIITGLKPHRVILVRGSKESTESLATRISELPDIKVFTPSKGDSVDATTETHIYQVRLTDGLVSALNFQKGKDMELAWLDSRVSDRKKSSMTKPIVLDGPEDGEQEPEEEEMEVDGGLSLDDLYTLEPIPISDVDPHEQVFVNEIKLSDLKVVLSKNQIDSEFSGGILWCFNNTIALRRVETGRVCLEGAVSENYYRVRELLYSQYAIL